MVMFDGRAKFGSGTWERWARREGETAPIMGGMRRSCWVAPEREGSMKSRIRRDERAAIRGMGVVGEEKTRRNTWQMSW